MLQLANQRMHAFAAALLASAIATGIAGCDSHGCTEIGCGDGLWLDLRQPNSSPVTVFTATITADGVAQSIVCPGPNCTENIVIVGGMPTQIRVDVSTSSRSAALEASPTYVVSTPNGPSCPPKCRTATVVVYLQ